MCKRFLKLVRILAIPVFAFSSITFGEGLQLLKFDSLSAKNLQHKGNLVEGRTYIDKAGKHTIIVCELKQGVYFEEGYRSELYAYSYLHSKDSLPKLEWQIKDFAGAIFGTIGYEKSSLNVFDLDKDGFAETSFFYTTVFEGADPWITKYMLHSKNQKYAIRGKIPVSVDDMERYEKNIDKTYNALPAFFKEYASKEWDRFMKDNFEVFKK